ncbi:MAG: extracellular solute-binding protein [Chloroflexi bacterium]|nr:extracellular solute-binding protein [Chloroflexota bacterium]
MSDHWFQKRLSRRDILKAAAVAAGSTAFPSILAACAPSTPSTPASGGTPAVAKSQEVHFLSQVMFVPEQDKEEDRQFAEWSQQSKVKVTAERVNQTELQPRIAAAIQAKAGPDIIELEYDWAWLYGNALADVTDVAQKITKEQGAFFGALDAEAKVSGVYKAVPHLMQPVLFAYRTDYFQQAGAIIPKTWDEYLTLAKTMKKFGKPVGQALGHSPADPNTFWYSWLWAHGGKEVEQDGKTVAINSPETVTAVEKAVEVYPYFIDGTIAWDDSSNNRIFLAGGLSATVNAASIYIVGKEQFPKVAEVTDHFNWPSGPAGTFAVNNEYSFCIPSYSKNQDAAKELLSYIMAKPQLEKWVSVGKGFQTGPTPQWADDPVYTADPKMKAFQQELKTVKEGWWGWPANPSAAAAQTVVQYVIVDMFAKACAGEYKPADAVKWAEGQLKGIYKS